MTRPCARQPLPLTQHMSSLREPLPWTYPARGWTTRWQVSWLVDRHSPPTFPKRCASVAMCGGELPTYSCGYSSGVEPAFPFNPVAEAPSGGWLSAYPARSQAQSVRLCDRYVAVAHHLCQWRVVFTGAQNFRGVRDGLPSHGAEALVLHAFPQGNQGRDRRQTANGRARPIASGDLAHPVSRPNRDPGRAPGR